MTPSPLARTASAALLLVAGCSAPATWHSLPGATGPVDRRPHQDSGDNLRAFSGEMLFDSTAVDAGPGLEVGYALWLSDEWRIDFLTAAGFDLYLDTDGEDLGSDNLQLSAGLALRYGF